MKNKTVVTVSRLWNNPHITTTVTNAEISLAMSGDDFIEAMLAELGSPAFVMTQKQLREKFEAAFQKVISGIKEESAKVV